MKLFMISGSSENGRNDGLHLSDVLHVTQRKPTLTVVKHACVRAVCACCIFVTGQTF